MLKTNIYHHTSNSSYIIFLYFSYGVSPQSDCFNGKQDMWRNQSIAGQATIIPWADSAWDENFCHGTCGNHEFWSFFVMVTIQFWDFWPIDGPQFIKFDKICTWKLWLRMGSTVPLAFNPLHAHDWDDEASVSSINGLPKLSWIAGGNICIHVQVLYVLYTVVILCHFDHC